MRLKAVASCPISSRDCTAICSSSWPAAVFWACSVPGTNDHVSDVGIPARPPHGHAQELRVLAERAELTGKAEIRREGPPPLLELLGDQAPVLSNVHPRLKDEEGHDDWDDGPEHA